MHAYPVLLNIKNRRCMVVGGGQVATRKVTALLDANAQVSVISPQISPTLRELFDEGRIEYHKSLYHPDYLTKIRPFVVIAATNNAVVNQQIAEESTQLNILVNVTDAPSQSTFTNMATIQRGPIVVGIATGGASAALSGYLKRQVEEILGPEVEILAEWMGEARHTVKTSNLGQPERTALWQKVLTSPILDLLRQGDFTDARELFDELLAEGMR